MTNHRNGDKEEPKQQETTSTKPSKQPLQRLNSQEMLAHLHPPVSWGENLRDALLRWLDHPWMQVLGILVIVLVIIDGAFFFFLLVGWQSLCDTPSKTNCEPRNWWYNWSIQVLNVLFTYMATASLPWRFTQFLHAAGWSCPYRSNAVGRDWYGQSTRSQVWCYIPQGRKLGILVLLQCNSWTQYANQVTRIIYYSFALQNEFPGNVWTNVFFAASFGSSALAGLWLGYEVSLLRHAQYHGQNDGFDFGPGPKQQFQAFYNQHLEQCFGPRQFCAPPNSPEAGGEIDDGCTDPTRDPHGRTVLPAERSSMRLFAM